MLHQLTSNEVYWQSGNSQDQENETPFQFIYTILRV